MSDTSTGNARWLGVLAILVTLAGYFNGTGKLPSIPELLAHFTTQPTVAPPPADAPDMLAVFSANPNEAERKQHAFITAEMLAGMRRCVEFDGNQPTANRRIKTWGHTQDARVIYREWVNLGFRFADKYPRFVGGCADFFAARLGSDGDKGLNGATALSDDDRRKLAKAYGDLEVACRYAWSKL